MQDDICNQSYQQMDWNINLFPGRL